MSMEAELQVYLKTIQFQVTSVSEFYEISIMNNSECFIVKFI